MKHFVEIPEEIEQALKQRASVTGEDVSDLIQKAVVSFVQTDVRTSPDRRLPDPPLDTVEIVPPRDLPRTDPRPVPVEAKSRRLPDPIADSA